tara:strand:- start:1656 stop:3830 length:2175 start_codon:yes stop_codon:yes gene_type:complete
MTISTTLDRISYAGNGSTTPFSFPYLFFADADLTVILVVDSTGVETIKTITSHYTITGAGDQSGGTVTMATPPASGETLVILRDADITQGLDLVENDPFPSDLIEQQFDKLTIAAQKLDTWANRTAKLTDGDTSGFDATLPNTHTADTALVINAAGTGFDVGPDVSDLSTAAANATAAANSATAAAGSAAAVGSVTIENFDGTDLTSSGTVLTLLTVTPTSENQVQVYVSGVQQDHTTFSLSGAVITFTAALPTDSGNLIEVIVGAVGIVGPTGATGATGGAGSAAPVQMVFNNTDEADEDKGTALIWLNNNTHANATRVYVDDNDSAGADISSWVASWDDVTTSTIRGTIIISQNAAPANYLMYNVTGATVDATAYQKIVVTYVTGAGTVANGDPVTVFFSRTGDAGSGLASIVEDTTPQLGGFLDSNNKFISNDQGANIASVAGDTNIWANFDGNTVHITGTNAITDFGTPKVAGDKMWVIFDGAASVVDSSTITCVGNTNYQAAANDMALVYALSTSTFLFIPFPNTAASWRTLTGTVIGTDVLAESDTPVGQHTIFVPAGAMEAAVTTAAATSNVVEIGTSLFAARTMDFATGADDFCYFGIQMPKSWDAGALVCQFVWSATGTTANTVLWGIAATSLGNDEVLTTAFPTPTSPAADTNSTTADDVMISAEVSVTVGSTPAAEDYVIFEVSRDVSGDTLAEDARLHGIKIHYTTNIGSDT